MRSHAVQPDGGRVAAPGAVPETEDSAADAARLRAERDAALAAVRKYEQRTSRRGMARRIVTGVLVFLFAILVPVTVTATWARRIVLNTDAYVNTVAPIAADPAVTAAVSRQITDQLYTALDPVPRIEAALPPRAEFLAGPIATGTKNLIQGTVDDILNSSQFQQLWEEANRFAHAQLVDVLRGNTELIQTTNGQVVLNLVPLFAGVVTEAEDFISNLVGKDVNLPAISADEVPSAACTKIAAALDRPVPDTCGQIPLFPEEKLTNAQRAVQAVDRIVIALLVLTPLLALAALWVSRRRRRTLLQLAIGAMLALVIVRRFVMWQEEELIDAARPENKAARTAILDNVLSGFFGATWWVLFGALVVVALALLTGPYQWAVSTRHATADGAKKLGRLVSQGSSAAIGQARDESTLVWVRAHADLLKVLGVAVALLLLLVFNLNFWWFLVVLALLGIYELLLYRLSSTSIPTSPKGGLSDGARS